MSGAIVPVKINILGKEYRIACSENERAELLACGQYLDQKMRKIRESGRITGTDKIAIMAALNIAHEMTQVQSQYRYLSETFSERLETIGNKLDTVLEEPTE